MKSPRLVNSDLPLLTIAIPTYNRAGKVKAQVERLLPQLRPGVRLAVFDNASLDNTHEILQPYIAQGLEYHRALYNCGSGRNFYWCIEGSESEWVWLLSDDDPVSTTVVNGLVKLLTEQECDYVNASPGYNTDQVIADIPSFCNCNTSGNCLFTNLLWISTCIYRRSVFLPFAEVFHESIYTMASQVVAVLKYLESGKGKILLSTFPLFASQPPDAPKWEPLNFLLRVSNSPGFLTSESNQKIMAKNMWCAFLGHLFSTLEDSKQHLEPRRWRRIRKQAIGNLKGYYQGGLLRFILETEFNSRQIKSTLRFLCQTFLAQLLALCPDFAFRAFASILPLKRLRAR
jgi:glycosyltransferase involved in cell wall biosynthesis